MGVSDSDQAAARRRLEVVQVGLRRLAASALTSGADMASSAVHGAVTVAMNELEGAVSLLSVPGEPPRVGCPYCGQMVTQAATLCGFCWRGLSPRSPQ